MHIDSIDWSLSLWLCHYTSWSDHYRGSAVVTEWRER